MNSLLHKLKQKIRGLSISVMRFVIKQPLLKQTALFILTKVPNTKAYFNTIALSGGLSTKQTDIKLTEFNDELGRVPIAKITASKINNINYFTCKIAQQLCQAYALNFDFDLIEKIRQGQQLNYTFYSGDKLKLTIVHFYLALLYRFPSNTEIDQSSLRVIKKNSFEPLIKTLLGSSEYKQRGRKEVIS